MEKLTLSILARILMFEICFFDFAFERRAFFIIPTKKLKSVIKIRAIRTAVNRGS